MDSPDKEETFDLREHKKRRGTRKGAITKVVKLFEPFKTYSLDDLNAEDLSKITLSAEEAVQNYNEEQSAIEEFQEESRYSGEDLSDAGQSTINLKLLTSVRDLNKAHRLWKQVLELRRKLKFLEILPSFSTEPAVEAFELFSQEYAQMEISARKLKDSGFKEIWNDGQTKFRPIEQCMIDQRRTDASVPHLPSLSISSSSSSPPSAPKHKLRELLLPSFTGDITEWRSFWKMFSEAMDVSFTSGEKLCYLRDCLKDPITSDIVREAISNQEDFSVVEERLRKKMNKPKEVFRKAISNIMNLGHLDYNKCSFYDISTCVLKSLHTLERYGDGSIY